MISAPQSTTEVKSQLHHYPPPPHMFNMQDEEFSHLEQEKNLQPPPDYPHEVYLPRLEQGDDFYLGSDEEDDWDDFEDVIFC